MPTLDLSSGAQVSVVAPTVATVSAVLPTPKSLQVVALPAGTGGGSDAYEFVQSAPAATWTISMPVAFPARRPAVDLYVNNVGVESDFEWYPLTKTIVVTFPSPTSGVAVIS